MNVEQRREAALDRGLKAYGVMSRFLDSAVTDEMIIMMNGFTSLSREYAYTGEVSEANALAGWGLGLLYCSYPVQVRVPGEVLERCLHWLVGELAESRPSGRGTAAWLERREERKARFPLKQVWGAQNKVNVYLEEVVGVVRKRFGSLLDQIAYELSPADNFTDDQMSAMILWVCSAGRWLGVKAPLVATTLFRNLDEAKKFGVAIKASGLNATYIGSQLVEMDTMRGRGVGELDLLADAQARCAAEFTVVPAATKDPLGFRAVIKELIASELGAMPRFKSLDDFWSSRWEWCVNGSHSSVLEKYRPEYVLRLPGTHERYRRMFAEGVERNPMPGWDGHTFVTVAPKLEHGKVRPLCAGDTMSYFAFEHLLRPVERCWRGRRIVLDPGGRGHSGMIQRLRKLRERTVCSAMLDFDHFDRQHSVESQSMVIDVLCEAVDYPEALRAKLVSSFAKTTITLKGREIGRATNSLMTGHRGTTFINSVLNAAYIKYYGGGANWEKVKSVHVGDDVYIGVPSNDVLDDLMGALKASPCELNPTKQSLGLFAMEFLRVATGDSASYGYLSRCISSMVSGNWVNELKLNPLEGLSTIINHSRTFMNRSGWLDGWQLLVPSAHRMSGLGKSVLSDLLSGRCSFNGTPVWGRSSVRVEYDVEVVRKGDRADAFGLPSYATGQYLANHASPVEMAAMNMVQSSLKPAMMRASYEKSLVSTSQCSLSLKVCGVQHVRMRGTVVLESAIREGELKMGVLSEYPLLHFMKSSFSSRQLRQLVELVGGDGQAADIGLEAWGDSRHGCVIDGWVSYTDAGLVQSLTSAGIVYTVHRYYI